MKKIISLLLILTMFFSTTLLFSSCNHECEFSEVWKHDEQNHWHNCTKLFCKKTDGNADHTWVEETVITEPTIEAEGRSEFVCSVCGRKKEDVTKIPITTKEGWRKSLDKSNFENFSCTQTVVASYSGIVVTVTTKLKIQMSKSKVQVEVIMGDQKDYRILKNSDARDFQKELVSQLKSTFAFGNYTYDHSIKGYKINEMTKLKLFDDLQTDDAILKFNDSILPSEFSCSGIIESSGQNVDTSVTMTFYDYGTTEVS